MKDFVSNRRVSILAWAAALSILWAIFVVPGGQPWAGYVWLAALAFLLVSTSVLMLGTAAPTSLVTVIESVETESTVRKP
jgi:hypothetical protein